MCSSDLMACGLPIIASNIMGHEELIQEGKNGYLVNLDEMDSWVSNMKKLIVDKTLAKSLGNKARETMVSDYSWDSCAKTYVYLLENEPFQ